MENYKSMVIMNKNKKVLIHKILKICKLSQLIAHGTKKLLLEAQVSKDFA